MNFIQNDHITGRKVLFFLGFIILIQFYTHPLKAGDFKLVKRDNDFSLYERWIISEEGEKVRELKMMFNVNSNVAAITRLLQDEQSGTNWNSNTLEYKIFKSGIKNTWLTYIKYDIPWPFDDQDCCLLYHFKKTEGSSSGEITFYSVSSVRFPESDQTDRIKGTRGKWVMEDLGNETVRITYLISTNRSKKIPRWISDPIVYNNLFSTMKAFKNLLEH